MKNFQKIILGWFHAVVQERMRYTPLGWSKNYEFSDAELRSGCDTIDQWLDIVAKGRYLIFIDNLFRRFLQNA